VCSYVGDNEVIDHSVAIRIGRGAIGWAAKHNEPKIWTRSEGNEDFCYYTDKGSGIKSMLAYPVSDGHQVTGVIVVDSRKAHAFSAREEKVMDVFARQLALIFEVQDLAQASKEEANNLKFLHDVGSRLLKSLKLKELLPEIMKQQGEIFHDLRYGFILINDQKTGKLEIREVSDTSLQGMIGQSFDLMEGLAGYIFQHHQEPISFAKGEKMLTDRPLFGYGASDLNEKSLQFIPLKTSGQKLGLIVLVSDNEQAFRESPEVLKILINHYSLALINAETLHRQEQLAVTDGLTQLLNHRHFQEILSQEFKRLERESTFLSLLMLDIDHFKKFNDTYGHPVGDQVLKKVARILKDSCREIDFVARYGGEEFAVLLINTDQDGAIQMAERIRQTIAKDTFMVDDLSLQVTASLGVATYPDNCTEKQSLIDFADQALYQAKSGGRNRVVHFSTMS